MPKKEAIRQLGEFFEFPSLVNCDLNLNYQLYKAAFFIVLLSTQRH